MSALADARLRPMDLAVLAATQKLGADTGDTVDRAIRAVALACFACDRLPAETRARLGNECGVFFLDNHGRYEVGHRLITVLVDIAARQAL